MNCTHKAVWAKDLRVGVGQTQLNKTVFQGSDVCDKDKQIKNEDASPAVAYIFVTSYSIAHAPANVT